MSKVIIMMERAPDPTIYDPGERHYEACELRGYTGTYVVLVTTNGEHAFSREDGSWLSGPCLNYRDYRVLDESLDEDRGGWHFRPQVAECVAAGPSMPMSTVSRAGVLS